MHPAEDADAKALRRRGLTLGLLTSAYFFSYMDRQILAILQEGIARDLHLSDTQLGLLAGFAFAIFYATLGIPVARWADRGNRITIISLALTLWSVMTALSGLAQNFTQLLLARIGVGIGEAGSSPPSHSIISDLYPPEKRAGAMSVFSLGLAFGGGLGTLIGGAVAAQYGWRVAMMTVGLPGIVLAIIIKLFAVEPRRGLSDPQIVIDHNQPMPSITDGFKTIWNNRAAMHLLLGLTVAAVIGYGNGAFVPSYLQRSLNMKMLDIALIFAPLYALAGAISAIIGGWIANRVAVRYGLYAQCYMIVAIKALALIPTTGAYLAGSPHAALFWFLLDALLTSSYMGTTFALLQGLAPIRLRSLWASITLFVINLVGLGLGPLLIGIASEALIPTFGKESLRYAMLAMTAITPWLLVHYWLAGRALRRANPAG